ncbi:MULTISPECIES: TIGR03279 family radical SAM protein [Prochlorococcus]|uniref:Fe-S oxidoreductase n=1 Tax=Prochlorococcus marinus (strain SARG / CCMP1375 / SS120) TaxID=167539 RepID=Q7VE96_PROMA|nr:MULTISPECIES: TIGR03279 family radical SAM protein [Prochlorococcus]AAP99163.1 Fe-S oxidoreductase [Prochlorococcus marinus subsp. marinus str. CCMP1375]KGG11567.1 putative Fe-S oxidoreductase [Prochlorococcus marinus str. LG]KGG18479.1 putative Fe-S oxidoreductase [Prochlorococcus marinus str. SS2]KGG22752.1 putative Fe-S oxidoreductase [Prochlorococcus marinus str. SS35]KGG32628.1 putative Fe-S oxidoreductase [Prochlorococcus marinus str. SS51]
MWKEPSPNSAIPSLTEVTKGYKPDPALIKIVDPGSIGEDLGFEAGDQLLTINGVKPRDLIDYKYLIAEEELELEVLDKNGERHNIQLEKNLDDDLGLIFTEALFDGLKQCNNNCSFCFIDQQPAGRRQTLYVKDDDYRMSFLYGSYLTLTNLMPKDWERIEAQRLSPLFVSVHATDSKLRSQLLKNDKAGLIMEQIKWFAEKKLQLHAQIVVCPGINDGKNLAKTINDLFQYAQGTWPAIISTAVVPVGLTRFRPDQDGLQPVNEECAKKVISLVERMQTDFQSKIGSRFAWLSDEWYLIANKQLPHRVAYEDLPQEENGVGSIRSFLEAMDIVTQHLPKKISKKKTCSWVVGKLVEQALSPISLRMNRIEGLSLKVFGLASPYWGKEKVVTGLLTGQDIINGLKNKELGDELLLPSVMLKHDELKFLDDVTVEEVANNLKIPIKIILGPDDFVEHLIGEQENDS